jgi:hypothetical protein
LKTPVGKTTVADSLQGIGSEERRELGAMLQRLAGLWAELTKAAAEQDQARLDAIQAEIAECRRRVDAIKRAGTAGLA